MTSVTPSLYVCQLITNPHFGILNQSPKVAWSASPTDDTPINCTP